MALFRIVCVIAAYTFGAACAARNSSPVIAPNGEGSGHKSYALPIVEIVAMDAGVNLAGRALQDPAAYEVSSASIRRNLRSRWVVDDDPFQINQFGHPYQGAMYHGIARSNGHGYWPSVAYTFAGSALWEIAGETTAPSFNDQIASGIAGSFLGEPLYRLSRLLLERSDHRPGFWRTLGSVLVSPPAGLNQLMVGAPRGSGAPDAVPFSDIRVQLGTTAVATGRDHDVSSLTDIRPRFAVLMDYGHPGNSAYQHERPFDYFRIETSASSEGMEHLSSRGLIAGDDYGAGKVGGLWGLYGAYDYFAPDDFRFSSTSLSLGTTLQAAISDAFTMQGSALAGAGYVAAHSTGDSDRDKPHYGVAPQALANVRLIAARRAALDVTARHYYVSSVGGFDTGQEDLIFVGDAWLAIRLFAKHAIGVTYQRAGRSIHYLALPDESRARNTVGVFYTFLGSGGFGAVR